ncbi:MAG TPA: alpha/beta hydrolase-fold protein [Streptosporangiaceae bacterium]|nr:alpha/beta hydrolase-fold protein [Streptosporangiaceae bacterium]
MVEPQGIAFFIVLMVVFGALVLWIIFTKQLVFRVLAACLAFVPAMLFGVAAVNKYYDYYQTWGQVAADFSNQGVATLPKVPQLGHSSRQIDGALGLSPDQRAEAQQSGYLFQTQISVPKLKISRTAFIFLPPQYFQAKYANYRFPVIELLHGSPGDPEQWVDPMNVLPTLNDLLAGHQADPAVLVMPDTDGGERYSLQCLNAIGGAQDATYIAQDVPDYIAEHLRVQPPGKAWGVAGLSEGGFCAANLALQYPTRYGYAGVMSGYFAPLADQVPKDSRPGAPIVYKNPFPRHKSELKKNTPDFYVNHIPSGVTLPQFWLSAGQDDPQDVLAAENFKQELQLHQAVVPLVLIPGASHNATAWRGALRPMFIWMTPQLTLQAKRADAALAARQRAAEKARAKKGLHPRPTDTVVFKK